MAKTEKQRVIWSESQGEVYHKEGSMLKTTYSPKGGISVFTIFNC